MNAKTQFARPLALFSAIVSGAMMAPAQETPHPAPQRPPAQAPTPPAQAPTLQAQAPTLQAQAPTLQAQAPTLPAQAPTHPAQAPLPNAPQSAHDDAEAPADSEPERDDAQLQDALEDFWGEPAEEAEANGDRAIDAWRAVPGFRPFALHFDPRAFATGTGGAMDFQSTTIENGVENRVHVEVGADGKARATITSTDPNGDKSERKIEADDLDSLRSQAPELNAALSGLSFGTATAPLPDLFHGWPFTTPPAPEGSPRGLRRLPLWPDSVPPMARGDAEGPKLGVQIRGIEADDPLRAHLRLESGVGLLVESVVPGSLAERIGVERFDVVTKIGDTPIGEAADVLLALKEADDGLVEVHVLRAGKPLLLTHEPDAKDVRIEADGPILARETSSRGC
ncbi:MAG: hypothetical protein IPH13_10855 [Planctomycetes bacterium]|nr:hypothetical protein [Planctomycetota bacterium]MCC7170715.1 hypothetical protein [Planctomycetota bacterium]